jgi:hypothetical protein
MYKVWVVEGHPEWITRRRPEPLSPEHHAFVFGPLDMLNPISGNPCGFDLASRKSASDSSAHQPRPP